MTIWAAHPARPLGAGFAVVAIGILVAIGTVMGMSLFRPILVGLAFSGFLVVLPTLVMRDPRAYWLFLYALSLPLDISKRTTAWLAEPYDLYNAFGLPASGTLSIDIYVTDLVLIAMLVPWLVRLCVKRESFYFPKIGYLFILYLIWALWISMFEARSFYLSIFEWGREILYFLAFVYVVNNVVTRTQFRAIVLALFLGLTAGAGSVIAFFDFGVGTETYTFAEFYSNQSQNKPEEGTLSEAQTGHVTSKSGVLSGVKRSSGIFAHPAHAAYYIEYILPIVLAYLVSTRNKRDRFLLATLFALGCLAIYLTFSRAGLVGLFCGFVTFFVIARWAELLSQRTFRWCVIVFVAAITVTAPMLIYSLWARPATITKRMELNEEALATIWQRPITGAGLNNSSAIAQDRLAVVQTVRGREVQATVVHNYYLIVLIEVGVVGFLLWLAFFAQTVWIGLRRMRAAETEMKLLLVGIIAGLSSVAVHNLGDPFGGHVVQGMLWLNTALIIAACRRVPETGVAAGRVDRLPITRNRPAMALRHSSPDNG